MDHKVAETTHNISNAFETANEWTYNAVGFQGLQRRNLKMGGIVAVHWKLTKTNWKQSLKLTRLQPQEKLLKNSALTILWLFDICSKLERWVH